MNNRKKTYYGLVILNENFLLNSYLHKHLSHQISNPFVTNQNLVFLYCSLSPRLVRKTTNPEPRSLEVFSSKQSNKNYILSLECSAIVVPWDFIWRVTPQSFRILDNMRWNYSTNWFVISRFAVRVRVRAPVIPVFIYFSKI